jgi:hypothetical protein
MLAAAVAALTMVMILEQLVVLVELVAAVQVANNMLVVHRQQTRYQAQPTQAVVVVAVELTQLLLMAVMVVQELLFFDIQIQTQI